MYRPCLHCEGKKYDKDYCPEVCTYGEVRKRLEEIEDALKCGRLIYADGGDTSLTCRDEIGEQPKSHPHWDGSLQKGEKR